MKKLLKKVFPIIIIGIISLVGLTSCKSDSKEEVNLEKKDLKLAAFPGPYDELFKDAIKPILEKKGYKIEVVDFTDLQLSDVAISEGSADFSVSQHTAYMNVYNENKNGNLVKLTHIPTVPAGIFSEKNTSLNSVKKESKVAIPQDPSNAARALALLQKAGWIKLKDGVELIKATANDIEENKYNIKIIEMNSSQIPPSLKDVDYAVIPGSIVYSAKIDAKKSLLSEDILKDLELALVVDEKNKDSKWAKDINDAYNSKEFKDYMKENNKDNYWFIPEEIK